MWITIYFTVLAQIFKFFNLSSTSSSVSTRLRWYVRFDLLLNPRTRIWYLWWCFVIELTSSVRGVLDFWYLWFILLNYLLCLLCLYPTIRTVTTSLRSLLVCKHLIKLGIKNWICSIRSRRLSILTYVFDRSAWSLIFCNFWLLYFDFSLINNCRILLLGLRPENRLRNLWSVLLCVLARSICHMGIGWNTRSVKVAFGLYFVHSPIWAVSLLGLNSTCLLILTDGYWPLT